VLDLGCFPLVLGKQRRDLLITVLKALKEQGPMNQRAILHDVFKRNVPAERIRAAFAGFSQIPGVMTTRSLGMIGALELEGRKGYLERGGLRVYHEALRRGAYLRPMGNVVYITPALNIGDADLDELLGIVAESVRAVTTSS